MRPAWWQRSSSVPGQHSRKRDKRRSPVVGVELLESRIAPVADLLPNLHVLPSYLSGWNVDTTSSPGHAYISYSTAMANGGPGPFYLRGTGTATTMPDGSPGELVNQIVYRDDGTSYERAAGTFEYHAAHGHVHFTDFALARLRIRGPGDTVGAVVASGEKTSFALLEMVHYADLPLRPEWPGGLGGGRTQGLRPGYADVYGAGLTGQSFEITGLANGNYWLEVVADPENHVLESNESDNVTRIPITLSGLPFSGFAVLNSGPQEAQAGPVDRVHLVFNRDVDAASFTPADVAFTGDAGAIAITAVVQTAPREFDIRFAAQTAVGTYRMNIGPDIRDTSGNLLDQNNSGTGGEAADTYFNIFTITAPRVLAVTPLVGSPGTVNGLRVTFNQAMDPATFGVNDIVSFTGPGGAIPLTAISGVTAVAGANGTQFDIAFTQQSVTGPYALTFGPDIRDVLGHAMNQDGDSTVGETPDDRFTAAFNLNFVGPDPFGYTATPATFVSKEILGQTGTFTVIDSGDDATAAIGLGSNTFTFYGATYTGASALYVNTNGLITFGSSTTAYSNGALGSSLSLPAIAPLWDDWITSSAGSRHVLARFVDVDSNGTPEQLVIEWNQPLHYSSSPSGVTFQAVLQLNTGPTPGTITFYYPDLATGDSTAQGTSATVGIRGSSTDVLQVANNAASAYVGDMKAIQVSVPTVSSIVRMDPVLTNEHHIRYQVTFSRPVTEVDLADFALAVTGDLDEVEIHEVTGSGAVYVVTLDTGHHDGEVGAVRLDLVDNDTIRDGFGALLGGRGLGNGNYNGASAYTVDKELPETTLLSGPAPFTSSTSATFTYTGSDNLTPLAGLVFEYSLDGNVWVQTASGSVTLTALSQGSHTLQVRAVDEAGNLDITPAGHTWTVDATAPDTAIGTKPPTLANSTTATFAFTGTDNLTAAANLRFEVRLDGGAWTSAAGSATFTSLGQGAHTFAVRAIDQAGNIDATPASYSWTIDSIAPDTTITTKPAAFAPSTSATFAFTGTEAGVRFETSLDNGAWAAAASPKTYTGLAQGSHNVRVRAIDAAGNSDATPATFTWMVDTVAPDTSITSKPAVVTSSTSATFAFTGSDAISAAANLRFEISLDGAAWSTAASPRTFTALAEGSHNLRVRSIDQASNMDASPASYSWTVTSTQPGYTVTNLGALGGTTSFARAVNNAGQATGYATIATGQYHAFRYAAGVMTDLGTLGGAYSYGMAINSAGDVAGYASTATGQTHAFVYTGGRMIDLGTLGGAYSYAMGINDAGQVVGYSATAGGQYHAFVWNGGVMTDLGTLGGAYSYATDINNAGQITGYAYTAANQYHAFRASGGVMTDLGALGGTYSVGNAINDAGQVAGYAYTAASQYHAFRTSGTAMTDLGTLGGAYSYAYGINAAGQVVGYAADPTSAYKPFLVSGTARYDLTTLLPVNSGWTISYAYGINDSGQIIAYGTNSAGQNRGLLLTPNSASFQRLDTTTQGTWKGAYGAGGYSIFQETSQAPSYATTRVTGASNYTWNASTIDVRALQKGAAGATNRIAATVYSGSSFTIDVGITDGKSHQVALYALDWDSYGPRSQRVEVLDGVTGRVLNTQTLSSFGGGQYLVWTFNGSVQIRVTNLVAGSNAVVSGLFFGA